MLLINRPDDVKCCWKISKIKKSWNDTLTLKFNFSDPGYDKETKLDSYEFYGYTLLKSKRILNWSNCLWGIPVQNCMNFGFLVFVHFLMNCKITLHLIIPTVSWIKMSFRDKWSFVIERTIFLKLYNKFKMMKMWFLFALL